MCQPQENFHEFITINKWKSFNEYSNYPSMTFNYRGVVEPPKLMLRDMYLRYSGLSNLTFSKYYNEREMNP